MYSSQPAAQNATNPVMIQYSSVHRSEAETGTQQGGHVVNYENKRANDSAESVQATDEHNGCFRVVRTHKSVEIPCTRNVTRRYKVSVPKTVQERVPRRVQYTDYETRERQEPFTVKRCETAYREEDQAYTVQVPQKVTRMVKVTKKVPRTVYVDVVTEEPQESTVMVPETRTRKIKVPYQKEVVDQQYRNVKEKVPVTKYRTEYDTVSKTVMEESWRTKVVPVTKLVHKQIPVYNVVPTGNCGNCDQIDTKAAVNNTFNSTRESNAEVQRSQPSPHQYRNTNRNPGNAFQVSPQDEQQPPVSRTALPPFELQSAVPPFELQTALPPVETRDKPPTGVMQNPEAAPLMRSAPVMNQSGNSQVHRPTSQSMNYPNEIQAINLEPTPMTNDAQPQYAALPRYVNINDARR